MSLEEKIEKAKALAEKNGLVFWKRCENNSGDELFLAKPKCNYKFVTTENQKRADERLTILLDIPAKHKSFMAAPFLGEVDAEKYISNYEPI